ncbi:hypothetical protein LOTGIDRAFT_229494 [Lottia gigantea]|uniref:Uncharacterized protein n=1 Tax=Lottia gigantea TaxID=225164 RepID=V3Z4T2_LOTGI|nr:hypothetical protein LOTGIDRAFT_229494 [Lottia gigantea]ESO85703.1 hypothetical protein LOTGIDRAFT_229494 [Lottia gigantea]
MNTFIKTGRHYIKPYYLLQKRQSNLKHIFLFSTTTTMSMANSHGAGDSPQSAYPERRGWMHILQSAKFKLDYNHDKTQVVVHHPGLSYEAYKRDSNPSISSLLMLPMTARAYAYHKPMDQSGATFLDYAKMTADHFTFMVSVVMEIESTMYDPLIDKIPLDVKLSLGFIGKTSLNSVAEVSLPSNGMTLMRNCNQVVLVDKATRKPTPVPDWWKQKYSSSTVGNTALIIPKLTKPESVHLCKLFVAWSDTDNYNHTTSASYPRFAVDAIHHASSSNFLKIISENHFKAGVKRVEMSFLGESAEGDLLEICVWEDQQKPIAYCEFLRGGETIHQSSVEYHTPPAYSDVGI